MIDGGALVVGYGNTLRSDDGLGRHVAERLADDPRMAGATVIGCHQLTPELALDVSRAAFVVLVDAGHGPPPGTFTVTPVEAERGSSTSMSHSLTPASLVALARELYGRAPDLLIVTGGMSSLEPGEGLSPAVEAGLPQLLDAVVELVRGRAVPSGLALARADAGA